MPGWRTVVSPAACSVAYSACGGDALVARPRRRRRQLHQALGRVDELAVQPAVGIPRDPAAGRLGGALVDLPAAQRHRVHHVLVAAAHQHHRVEPAPPRRDRRAAAGASRAAAPRASRCSRRSPRRAWSSCTRAATAAATSASDRARDRSTPGPPPAPCRWLSIRPGTAARPPRSTSRAPGPASARIWPPSRWRRSDRRDGHGLDGRVRRSTVCMRPLNSTSVGVGGGCCATTGGSDAAARGQREHQREDPHRRMLRGGGRQSSAAAAETPAIQCRRTSSPEEPPMSVGLVAGVVAVVVVLFVISSQPAGAAAQRRRERVLDVDVQLKQPAELRRALKATAH